MTETEFRINHSRIIEYYQYIEMRLKVICAELLSDEEQNWFERLNKYESDPLGKLIRKIKAIHRQKNIDLLTSEDFETLEHIRESRNYWVHQCFAAPEHVTIRKKMVRNPKYAERIMEDLAVAETMDQVLADKVHILSPSVLIINED